MASERQLDLFATWGSPIEEAVYQAFPEGESLVLEYKSAKGGFPDSFWETYSAFANTEGGIIVLGVREKNYSLIPDGLSKTQIQQYRKVFFDTANNRNKISSSRMETAVHCESSAQWVLESRCTCITKRWDYGLGRASTRHRKFASKVGLGVRLQTKTGSILSGLLLIVSHG